MALYTGNDAWFDVFNLPELNQTATPESVADQVKGLADRSVFNLRRMGMMAVAACPLWIVSTDGLKATCGPISGVTTFDTTGHFLATIATDIDKLNIEGPPFNFQGSTYYAIYVFWQNGQVKFQISLTMPEPAMVFKLGTMTHRFIGGLFTDAGAKIRKFSAARGFHGYHSLINAKAAGADTIKQPIPLKDKGVPVYATSVALRLRAVTTIAAPPLTFPFAIVGPKGADFNFDGVRMDLAQGVAGAHDMIVIEHFPMGGDRELEYFVDAATTNLTVDVMGYSY